MSYRKGFSIVEVLIVIAVIALLGFVGYKAWQAWQSGDSKKTADTSTSQNAISNIKSASDLDKAATLLDNANIDGDESTNLTKQTNF